MLRKFNKRLMENQQKGLPDPVTPAYDETLADYDEEVRQSEYLKKVNQYLMGGEED